MMGILFFKTITANPLKVQLKVCQECDDEPFVNEGQVTLVVDTNTHITCVAERSVPPAMMVVKVRGQEVTDLLELTTEMTSEEVFGGFTRRAYNTIITGIIKARQEWNNQSLTCETKVSEQTELVNILIIECMYCD